MNFYKKKLGLPDLKLGGLQIWCHGRQFPDAKDYWDANWLNVTIHCKAIRADVWTQGSLIHLGDLQVFLSEVKSLNLGQRKDAHLPNIEPNLSVDMKVGKRGEISMKVEISPDNLTQKHTFIFEIDLSYLTGLERELKGIFQKFPLIGRP
jgi:hypothetical protein